MMLGGSRIWQAGRCGFSTSLPGRTFSGRQRGVSMNTASAWRLHAAVLLAAVATAGCSSAVTTTTAAPQPSLSAGGPRATTASNNVNPADLKFVTGMIHHHAQAILMAGWAGSHGARPDVLVLCER